MKKLNAKGFTLIELLAVVTIMGILLLVAIPAVSRTIENTRRDTFMNTAREYVNSVETLWLSDGLECKTTYTVSGATKNETKYPSQAADGDEFYVRIDSANVGKNQDAAGNSFGYYVPVLLEKGGKSSWNSADVTGYVKVLATAESAGGRDRIVPHYYVAMSDGVHGIPADAGVEADGLKRKHVAVSAVADIDMVADAGAVAAKYICEEA